MLGSQESIWIDDEITKFSGETRFTKVGAIMAFIFIILALMIIVKTPPASGYEISIYNVYPWYFWVFIIASIFIGQMIILSGGNGASKISDNYWKIGEVNCTIKSCGSY